MGEYEDMFGCCSWCSQVLSLLMLTENRELPKKKKTENSVQNRRI